MGGRGPRSAGIPNGARIASDRVDPNRFYGFSGGAFYLSTDRGVSFAATGVARLPSTGSVKLKAVPGFKGHVWLAGGNADSAYGLWFSKDSGLTFKRVKHVDEADVVGFGREAPGGRYPALYASAKIRGFRGIFRSDDGGGRWTRINDDEHQYAYTGQAITGDPRVYGRVYVSTNGRGVVYGEPGRGCDDDHGHH